MNLSIETRWAQDERSFDRLWCNFSNNLSIGSKNCRPLPFLDTFLDTLKSLFVLLEVSRKINVFEETTCKGSSAGARMQIS